jgi:hypothetical protein
MMSRVIRDLLLDKAVTDFVSLIFQAPPQLTASRASLRETSPPDRDVARHAYTLPLQFLAVTFSLEQSDEARVSVWPGSQRLPDLPWSGFHITLAEAQRAKATSLEREIERREQLVRGLVHQEEPRWLRPGAGSRTIRHANLIHAIEAPRLPLQRRTITGWYCPSHVEPCHAETTRARKHTWNGFRFSSGIYPMRDPLD